MNAGKEAGTNELLLSSDTLDLNELWLDMEDIEMVDFMKLLK